MLFPPWLIPWLKLLYPISELHRIRDRPLEVLAVGLSRSGTDSLRSAIKLLGYNECHHGFYLLTEAEGEAPQWCRLAWRKYHTDATLSPAQRGLDAAEFDKCIGNCAATTDAPSIVFACELIRAYPDAKVIVNKRDMEAWHRSMAETLGSASLFGSWSTALFDPYLFWVKAGRDFVMDYMMGDDFARTGRERYMQHYANIEHVLEAEKQAGREREVLRWQVEDGWNGLSEFLGKPIPIDRETGVAAAFPKGNDVTDFHQRRLAIGLGKAKRAKRRRTAAIVIVSGVLLSSLVRVWYLYLSKIMDEATIASLAAMRYTKYRPWREVKAMMHL